MNARGGGSNLKENVLETKWMTLSKMSKKVSDLEKQNKQLKESSICEKCGGGSNAGIEPGSVSRTLGNEGLPKVPEKFTMTGHRDKITKLQIHP